MVLDAQFVEGGLLFFCFCGLYALGFLVAGDFIGLELAEAISHRVAVLVHLLLFFVQIGTQ